MPTTMNERSDSSSNCVISRFRKRSPCKEGASGEGEGFMNTRPQILLPVCPRLAHQHAACMCASTSTSQPAACVHASQPACLPACLGSSQLSLWCRLLHCATRLTFLWWRLCGRGRAQQGRGDPPMREDQGKGVGLVGRGEGGGRGRGRGRGTKKGVVVRGERRQWIERTQPCCSAC